MKSYIKHQEIRIRNCYERPSLLRSDPFVDMILDDAVFIIELFLRNYYTIADFLLEMPYYKNTIKRDLQLLENQLPYFVLHELYMSAIQGLHFCHYKGSTSTDHPSFLDISCKFFDCKSFADFSKLKGFNFKHFTDLRRSFLLMDFLPQNQTLGKHVSDLPTATELHLSGVKFKKEIKDRSLLGINCVQRAKLIPFTSCGELRMPFTKELTLQIPPIVINDLSECLYQNLMVLELWLYKDDTHICNFILLMDRLINTKKDVDLLVDQGIISSSLGDNATVATMFNNLGLQITTRQSVYHSLGEMLKKYYDSHGWVRFLNRNMAILITVYFVDLWTATRTFAAVLLLVLTFIQTLYAIP